MAKQMGIHQIRGKVGGRSYYKTKGVVDGISRSINQGLSARVKSAEEYANTRLNNAEFKNANAIAAAAFKSVASRSRGMMVNFAIAEMTKRALEDIKQGSGSWGARHPLTELDALSCDMLENYAKGGTYQGEYGTVNLEDMTAGGVVSGTIVISTELQASLLDDGIQALQFVVSRCLAGEIDVDGAPRLFAGHAPSPIAPVTLTGDTEVQIPLNFSFSTPASVGMSQSGYSFAQEDPNHGFFLVFTVLPMRRIDKQQYVLQEKCTYFAVPVGQIPEP